MGGCWPRPTQQHRPSPQLATVAALTTDVALERAWRNVVMEEEEEEEEEDDREEGKTEDGSEDEGAD